MNSPSQVELNDLVTSLAKEAGFDKLDLSLFQCDLSQLRKFAQLLLQREGGSAGADVILNDLAWSVKKLQADNPKHGEVLTLVIDQIFSAKSKAQQTPLDHTEGSLEMVHDDGYERFSQYIADNYRGDIILDEESIRERIKWSAGSLPCPSKNGYSLVARLRHEG